MMTKLYVLERGEYSDARPIGVFSTLELAQQALPSHDWRKADWRGEEVGWWGEETIKQTFSETLTIYEFELDNRKATRELAERF